ncbi:MAG: hypothetical protein M3144_08725 [Actinomycetota bacterium]|nr:hypothetical protein [Actinomycetota bacterium]
MVRNARAEACDRIGGRFDVRVLEPSPPAVHEPPYLAEDPVAGGEVVPVRRAGARAWADVCDGDADLISWCRERWLVPGPLAPLPAGFGDTRTALHALAEHVLAPCRHAADGKIGLRFTYRGFGTPFFGDDRQVRVEGGVLVDGDRRHRLTTLRAACDFLAFSGGAPVELYAPTTLFDLDAPLAVDADAAVALGHWFGFTTWLVEQLRAEAGPEDGATRPQLWPEHFDIAIALGRPGQRANYGGSPGDDAHPEPYLYVGPFDTRTGSFWNEPFGASLSYQAILAGADPLAFFRRGRDLLRA